ncbi:MAG: DUF1566 domain-containing protein [Syntrophales bacterium]
MSPDYPEWAWASEIRGSDADLFYFTGGTRLWYPQSIDYNGRAIPVRQKAALDQERKELAREKRDLERQKTLDAEREQLSAERRKVEAERQQLALAKRPPFVSTAGESGRDGRFIGYSNGTVLDTKTNLMWAAKDSGSDINWEDARNYSEHFRGGGYGDWRMPTQEELAELYDVGRSYKSNCGLFGTRVYLTELIRLTCSYLWASNARGSDAAIFDFSNGARYWLHQSSGNGYRALLVRFGK